MISGLKRVLRPYFVTSPLTKTVQCESVFSVKASRAESMARCHVEFSPSSSSFAGSDVTKLTNKDEGNIVFSLNSFSKEQLQKTGVLPSVVIEEMLHHRSVQGPFLSLGEVLSLPGMDNEVFKNICNSFKSKQFLNSISSSSFTDYSKYFSPTLSRKMVESVQTVTSLEVCLDCVCFASLSRDGNVIEWDRVPLLGTDHIKQTPAQILEQAFHVVQEIPKADVYLVESKSLRRISTQYVSIHLFIARLQASIQTLISSDHYRKTGQHSFFHVRDTFVSRMFDLQIGGERVSCQHVLQQMEDGDIVDQATLTKHLWRSFHSLQSEVQKERFANCLMMAVAFKNYVNAQYNSNR